MDWYSLDLMEDCRKQGLLYYFKIKDEVIGLIAGEKKQIFNSDAVYIDEIMISEGNRGKKYSTLMMRKFIEKLNDSKYIWSHIDSRNIGSLKTALKIGQKVISEEFFIDV